MHLHTQFPTSSNLPFATSPPTGWQPCIRGTNNRKTNFACQSPARCKPCPENSSTTCNAETASPIVVSGVPDLPATYKRLVARRCGASFRQVATVVETPLQLPGPGEVLIRVTHAGVNGGCETFRARGEHAFAANRALQDFPLGAEGAGVVVALGSDVGGGRGGGGLKVGQRVALNGAAAFAEFVSARPSLVTSLPDSVGGSEGAALVLSGVTACAALEATARVRPGEVVVVTAAAGGTGHLAVQLAAAAGATVVAVVGGERKAEAVSALGAHVVVDRRRRQDVAGEMRRLFPAGVDVVYDGVGGELRDQLLGCLGPTGRLLQVGYISEYPHTKDYRWEGGSRTSGGSTGGSSANAATATPGDATAAAATQMAAASAAASSTAKEDDAAPPLPSSSELFWRGLDVSLGQRRLIGQVWPKDLKAILRCRRRVFDLAGRGQLRVITDQGHGRKGVEGIADAVEYMLRGEHVGKVVIEL